MKTKDKPLIRVKIILFTLVFSQFSFAQSWEELGPFETYHSNTANGIGRIYSVAFDPNFNTNNTMYASSPYGGLWKSTNGGSSWSNDAVSTDQLPFCGVTEILVHPTDGQTIYVATGDGQRGLDKEIPQAYTAGLYKTTDGGANWAFVGPHPSYDIIGNRNRISVLAFRPNFPNTIFAGTTDGLYRSTNGGTVWSLLSSNGLNGDFIRGIAYDPNNVNRMYVSGTKVFRSDNHGTTFTELTGLETAVLNSDANFNHIDVINIDVDHINGNVYAYVVYSTSKYAGAVFFHDGTGWSLMKTISEPKGFESDRCEIKATPGVESQVYVGATNVHQVWDNGTGFSVRSSYYGGTSGLEWRIHPDIHELFWSPNDTVLYVGNDGGLSQTTTDATSTTDKIFFQQIEDGLSIATIRNIGISARNSELALMGAWDNGSSLWNNESGTDDWKISWSFTDGGYQMIDYSNDSVMITGSAYSDRRPRISFNKGKTFSNIKGNEPMLYEGQFDRNDIVQDPVDPDRVYYLSRDVLYTDDLHSNPVVWTRGSFFDVDHCLEFGQKVTELAISTVDNNIMYTSTFPNIDPANPKPAKLFKSTTRGGEDVSSNCPAPVTPYWVDVTPDLPASLTALEKSQIEITSIAISENDVEHVWVSYSNFFNGVGVKYTYNGGQDWVDYNNGLPEVPINFLVCERDSYDRVYAGTAVGLYYRDASMSQWKSYKGTTSTGEKFPNTIVSDLEMNYSDQKLFVGTLGRGLWKGDLICPENQSYTESGTYSSTDLKYAKVITSTADVNTQKVTYRASEVISLKPGFKSDINSEFRAYIQDNCSNAGVSGPKRMFNYENFR